MAWQQLCWSPIAWEPASQSGAFTRKEGNKYYAAHGETIVCAIEFAKNQRANCLLSYGNSSQPGSPHLGDQLPLLSQKKLHPVWREKKDVEAHLEKRETL